MGNSNSHTHTHTHVKESGVTQGRSLAASHDRGGTSAHRGSCTSAQAPALGARLATAAVSSYTLTLGPPDLLRVGHLGEANRGPEKGYCPEARGQQIRATFVFVLLRRGQCPGGGWRPFPHSSAQRQEGWGGLCKTTLCT